MWLLNDDLDHPDRAGLHASDHAPVVATFDYNPAYMAEGVIGRAR